MKKITLLSVVMSLLLLIACQEDTFMGDSEMVHLPPSDLKYMDMEGAREGQRIVTFAPAVETGGLIPYFEIVQVKDASGNVMDEEFMKYVSIANPEEEPNKIEDTDEEVMVVSYKNAGAITVYGDSIDLDLGGYTFDVKVKTTLGESQVLETVFEDGFKLAVGPGLVSNLNYSPKTQNLLLDGSKQTSKPSLGSKTNPDVRFELASHTDIFVINTETGVIKLKDGVTVEEGTYLPQVNVISNISNEVVTFQGKNCLTIIVSEEPVVIPLQSFTLFYPNFLSENATSGYRKFVIKDGGLPSEDIWKQTGACSELSKEELETRPTDGVKSLMTNIVIGQPKESSPHESWVVLNAQNFEAYSSGFNLSAGFWIKNRYVEYMTDGRTPTNLEVYVSTDFTNSVEDANWKQVNTVLKCEINNSGKIITGTPYPGDQKGEDPDGLKSTTTNADDKWVKCILDLNPYKESTNFTLAFKFASYFDTPISVLGKTGRGGTYYISDVHMQATELPQE